MKENRKMKGVTDLLCRLDVHWNQSYAIKSDILASKKQSLDDEAKMFMGEFFVGRGALDRSMYRANEGCANTCS